MDENQGITYILLSDNSDSIMGYYNIEVARVDQIEKVGITYITLFSTEQGYHLYHERNSYEDFDDDMSIFVNESDSSCYKLYKWVDEIIGAT